MFDDYEFYQGVVLRNLIVNADFSVMVRPFVREGRISAFVINSRIGVFMKHSTKRMSPWRFTFGLDQVSDLLDLEAKYFDSFVVFICGSDGLVTLDVARCTRFLRLTMLKKLGLPSRENLGRSTACGETELSSPTRFRMEQAQYYRP